MILHLSIPINPEPNHRKNTSMKPPSIKTLMMKTLPIAFAALLAMQTSARADLTVGVESNPANFSASGTNLTTAGPADWVQFGSTNNRKNISPQRIAHSSGGQAYTSDNTYPGFSWTDGTPNATGTNVKGIRHSLSPNLTVTIPAGSVSGTLKYWTGGGNTANTKWVFDLAGDSQTATTIIPTVDRNLYTIAYSGANPAGDTLTVKFLKISDSSNVNTAIFAAALEFNLPVLTVTYDGNGYTGGAVPQDISGPYVSSATVTVLGNPGGLTRTGYTFSGWNTLADGSGTTYNEGGVFNITGNTTLYAKWVSADIDHFAITGIASTQTAGAEITGFTITAQDSGNNTVTSYTTPVTFGGTAGATGISPVFVAGQCTTAIATPTVAGSDMTITVGDGVGHTGTFTITTVNPGAASQFVIDPNPVASATAGTPFALTSITAKDANGNDCSSGPNEFTGTVDFSGTAGVTGTSAAFSGGVLASPSVTATSAGSNKTIIATQTGGSISATATITNVSPGAAAMITGTSGDSQNGTIGEALYSPFVVTVADANGNPVSGIPVNFAVDTFPGGAAGQSLSVTGTVTDGSGLASSTLTLGDLIGTYTVTATSGSLTGSPVTFTALANVNPLPPVVSTPVVPGPAVDLNAIPNVIGWMKALTATNSNSTNSGQNNVVGFTNNQIVRGGPVSIGFINSNWTRTFAQNGAGAGTSVNNPVYPLGFTWTGGDSQPTGTDDKRKVQLQNIAGDSLTFTAPLGTDTTRTLTLWLGQFNCNTTLTIQGYDASDVAIPAARRIVNYSSGQSTDLNQKLDISFGGVDHITVVFANSGNAGGQYATYAGPQVAAAALTGTSPDYTTWANDYPGHDLSDPAGDNDGDGLVNQQEYAFGLNPISGSSVSPITAQLSGNTFSYTRREGSGLTYTVYYSTDLATWTSDAAAQTDGALVGSVRTVNVTLTGAAVPDNGKLFVKVGAK